MGCAPRGALTIQRGLEDPTQVQRVFVASNRVDPGSLTSFGSERSTVTNYGRIDLSIPENRAPGSVTFPRGTVNPKTDFYSTDAVRYTSAQAFLRAVRAERTDPRQETFVFVHGYNENLAEASYRLAQIAWDYEVPFPAVAYDWPSAAATSGYVYDRDSVIFARDDLETLLKMLTSDGSKVALVAHSMGSQLVMEVLRQIAISNSMDMSKIASVSLVEPDIDEEVFERQASRIPNLPQPFSIFVSAEDGALFASSILTGRLKRLGSIRDPEKLGDLPVNVFDLTALAKRGSLNHSTLFESPAAIAQMKELLVNDELPNLAGTRVFEFKPE
ncbi:MAG: alpha/beta fold hydrolase [Pseudomonadota bacterium]